MTKQEMIKAVNEKVEEMGFITNSKYPNAGYSPDGLIGENGLWECKAFKEERHLKVFENLDAGILAQIQFGLLITERDWCDLTLFNPDIEDISNFTYDLLQVQDNSDWLEKQLDIYSFQKQLMPGRVIFLTDSFSDSNNLFKYK